jgi:hypothetical protein
VSISTFNSENLIGYAQSAGNLSFVPITLVVKNTNTDKSSSETTRGTPFNFEDYRNISSKNPYEISDNWLT